MDETKTRFSAFVKTVTMLLTWKKNFCLTINFITISPAVGSRWKLEDHDGGRATGCVRRNRDGGWVSETGAALEGLDGQGIKVNFLM